MMNKEEELAFLKDFLEKTKKLIGDCTEVEDLINKEDYVSAYLIIHEKLKKLKKEIEVHDRVFETFFWIFVH